MDLKNRPSILFLPLCLLIITIIPKANSQDLRFIQTFCSLENNTLVFPPNNSYNSTFNTLLQYLTSNATTSPNGFYSTSVQDNTIGYTFNAYFLCRGDLDSRACHDCVSAAVTNKSSCPQSVRQTMFYDQCLIRYSNDSLDGVLATDPVSHQQSGSVPGNNGDWEVTIRNTFRILVLQAANNQTGKKYASTAENFNTLTTLYALAQCKPDLSVGNCQSCLTNAVSQLQVRGNENYLTPSCYIRYDTYPFFEGADSLTPGSANTGMSNNGSSVSTPLIIGIVAAVAVISALLASLGVISIMKKKVAKYRNIAKQHYAEDTLTVESLQYDLALIQSSTNNFSKENKLGEGGFGIVYKGTLMNGQNIAVKRLSLRASQGEEEFKNEVLLVAKLQHRNLVRLLGFCLTEEEKILIYEFVPNRSLEKILFDREKSIQLDWRKRYEIIEGIARGMLYLHEDSRVKIIHRDLKASNILLDEDMNPKVSDFGTARIFGGDQTQACTSKVVGTLGYMAPEYLLHGNFSAKSDVYSFGILVLEIISGEKNSGFNEKDGAPDLISYAWMHWRNWTPLLFVDSCIRDQSSAEEAMRCMNLGLLCVQDADQRPSMSTIALMLNSISTSIPVPKEPTMLNYKVNTDMMVVNRETNNSSNDSMKQSSGDVSITMPR